MPSSFPLLATFTLFLLSIFNPSLLVEPRSINNNFAHRTCNRIQYEQLYKICIPVVDSDPREDLKSNLTGLLIIFLNHSINNFNDNIGFLHREIKSGKLNGKTKMMYGKCLEAFEMGNSDLQESLHILLTQTSRDVYGLPLMIAGDHISLWVDDFEGDPIPPE